MNRINERMGIVTSIGGAMLELQEVVEACCRQTVPEEALWEDDDDLELWINEPVAQRFLQSFDPDDLLKKFQHAHTLIAEAELRLFAYRMESQL